MTAFHLDASVNLTYKEATLGSKSKPAEIDFRIGNAQGEATTPIDPTSESDSFNSGVPSWKKEGRLKVIATLSAVSSGTLLERFCILPQ